MKLITLGKTGLRVTKTAMGCLPVQRCGVEEGAALLRAAYEGGINYFDTANAYSDSEMKLGLALSDVRDDIVISSKSAALDKAGLTAHIDNSLKMMRTDRIDLFQFHNIKALPDMRDPDGIGGAALEAKRAGKILHIGVTTHSIDMAEAAIESGDFETLQYPFSYISSPRELALPGKCAEAGMGYIAMKGLAGGLLGPNARACHAFMKGYENVTNIWGMQSLEELKTWLALAEEDPGLDPELQAVIDEDRRQLSGTFCRSCGYCEPCTVGIVIHDCNRMNMLLRRSPWRQYYSPEYRAQMEKIKDCVDCGQCKPRCPYGLDVPNLLKFMLKDYNEFYDAHKAEL